MLVLVLVLVLVLASRRLSGHPDGYRGIPTAIGASRRLSGHSELDSGL